MADPSPFEILPDTPEQQALEADLNAAIEGLLDRLIPVYAPGGPLARATPLEQLFTAAGTIMLRIAAMSAERAVALHPDEPEPKMWGNAAILLARSAGFLTRDMPPAIQRRLLAVMTREMITCSGLAKL